MNLGHNWKNMGLGGQEKCILVLALVLLLCYWASF